MSGIHILLHIFSDIISGAVTGLSSETLCPAGSASTTASKTLQLRSAGTAAIKSLQLRSGGEHCDQELAVDVRRNTAIKSLQLRSSIGGRAGGGRRDS